MKLKEPISHLDISCVVYIRVATLAGNLEKPGTWEIKKEKLGTWEIKKEKLGNNFSFEQKSQKKQEVLTIFSC